VAKQDKHQTRNQALRWAVYLEGLKSHEVVEFVQFVAELQKVSIALIYTIEATSVGELSKTALAKFLATFHQHNEAVLEKALQQLFTKLEPLSAYAAQFAAREIKALAKVAIEPATFEQAYKFALEQPLSATGQKLPEFLQAWTDAELNRLNNIVQKAWGEGSTVNDLVRAIRGTKAQNFRDGILELTRRNAEAIARTSIQHVASTGRMATWEENKDIVKGYEWISTLDSRTTTICRSLDHQSFKLGEGPVPPAHINCRSTTIAELDSSLDFLDQGATRSAQFGPVDADLTYYEWLKLQPETFQDSVLGAERGKLFRDGGLTSERFAALNLGRNFQPLTLAEMQALEPNAFEKAGVSIPKLN
jgi:SPP1 gp7 family putative phage head morphogenesis protein